MTVIEMLLNAPLIGLQQRWPRKLHAVDVDGVPLKGGLARSVCGLKGLRLLPLEVGGETTAALWPPRVRGMPARFERCRPCFDATKPKRPRTQWGDS